MARTARGEGRRAALVDGNQWFSRAAPRLADCFERLVVWLNGEPAADPLVEIVR